MSRVTESPRRRLRKIPSARETRAVSIGCDELLNLASWTFRNRPKKIRNIRARYRKFCVELLREIERASEKPVRRERAA
jgi:hypothetical protein